MNKNHKSLEHVLSEMTDGYRIITNDDQFVILFGHAYILDEDGRFVFNTVSSQVKSTFMNSNTGVTYIIDNKGETVWERPNSYTVYMVGSTSMSSGGFNWFYTSDLAMRFFKENMSVLLLNKCGVFFRSVEIPADITESDKITKWIDDNIMPQINLYPEVSND